MVAIAGDVAVAIVAAADAAVVADVAAVNDSIFIMKNVVTFGEKTLYKLQGFSP